MIGDLLGGKLPPKPKPKPRAKAVAPTVSAITESPHCTRVQDLLMAQQRDGDVIIQPGQWIRSSSAHKACARLVHYGRRGLVDVGETFDGAKLFVFAAGTAYHHAIQNVLLPDTGVLLGWWRCPSCAHVNTGHPSTEWVGFHAIRRPHTCAECDWSSPQGCVQPRVCVGSTCECRFEYVELSFRNPDLRLSGHMDGILSWGDGRELLEAKSIGTGPYGFVAVDPRSGHGPKWEHIIQSHIYMKASGVHRARIVYVAKADLPLVNVMAEHVVDFDPALWDDIELTIRQTVAELDAPSSAAPARALQCTSKGCDMARWCKGKKECW